MSDFHAQVQAYDNRVAGYLPDVKVVESLLSDEPLNVEALRPYASKTFDSWCSSPHGICGCVYCRARRAIGVPTVAQAAAQIALEEAERRGYERARRRCQ